MYHDYTRSFRKVSGQEENERLLKLKHEHEFPTTKNVKFTNYRLKS